ncbi:MAG: allantoinase, partial [Terriglobales bacterium]
MDGRAFVSRRVATPDGIRPAAILVPNSNDVGDGTIAGIVPANQVPADTEVHDFGDAVILPGLIDSHLHINDPGRADWEGFETATRAAAAGGYATLVDMPLN